MPKRTKVFISYVPEDDLLRRHLNKHLSQLKRDKVIEVWDDQNIKAGENREEEIKTFLNAAQVVLLLVSPDFMASDYHYGVETKQAMERHKTGKTTVVPIILRPVAYKGALFEQLPLLPTGKEPITTRLNLDQTFCNVTEELHLLIRDLCEKRRLVSICKILNRSFNRLAPITTHLNIPERAKMQEIEQIIQQAEKITIRNISEFNLALALKLLKDLTNELSNEIEKIKKRDESKLLQLEQQYAKTQNMIETSKNYYQQVVLNLDMSPRIAFGEFYSEVKFFYIDFAHQSNEWAIDLGKYTTVVIFNTDRIKAVLRAKLIEKNKTWQSSVLQPLLTAQVERGKNQVVSFISGLKQITRDPELHDIEPKQAPSGEVGKVSPLSILHDHLDFVPHSLFYPQYSPFRVFERLVREGWGSSKTPPMTAQEIMTAVQEIGDQCAKSITKMGQERTFTIADTVEKYVVECVSSERDEALRLYNIALSALQAEELRILKEKEFVQKEIDGKAEQLIQFSHELGRVNDQLKGWI